MVVKAAASSITAEKQVDSITIRDIELAIAGTGAAAVEIIARRLVDNLTITKSPATNLTIKD